MADRTDRRRQVEVDIERAALELFLERGIEGVTVEEIATAAGVSTRTFFRYFPFKLDVVLTYYRRRQHRVLEVLAGRPPHEPAFSALKNALLTVIPEGDDDAELARLRRRVRTLIPGWAMASASAAEREEMVHLVALRLGVDPTTDIRPYVFVDSAVAATLAAHDLWLAGGCQGDVVTRAAEAFDMLEAGFSAAGTEVNRHATWQAPAKTKSRLARPPRRSSGRDRERSA
jgi:TetR/AcrR family transcriptional regulator, regulator of mycofactocin system